jgi:DNA-binding CsgD family transcriptional regulator
MLTEREVKIAALAVEGHSQREIGKLMGMSQQNVSRILNREEIKVILEEAQQIIAQAATDAADNMVESARYFKDYLTKVRKGEKPEGVDRQLLDYGFKASREIGKATGSLAGENTSIFIQNMYNQQTTILDPAIGRLISRLQGDLSPPEEEVID